MTNFGTFSKLAFYQIFRNKRRTFGAIIGIVLALVLVVGSEIAINETATNVFKKKLDRIPVDLIGYYYGSTSIPKLSELKNLTNDIKNLENIESTALIGGTWAYINKSNTNDRLFENFTIYQIPIIVISEDSFYTRKLFGVNKSFGFSPGKFSIYNHMAKFINITVGEKISFVTEVYDYEDENYTFSYLNITCGELIDFNPNSFNQEDYYYEDYYEYFDYLLNWGYSELSIFVDMDTYLQFLKQIPEEHYREWTISPDIYIWLDRDEIIEYGNLAKTKSNIIKLQNELDYILRFDGELDATYILDTIEEQESWLWASMVIYFGFSIPVMALGIYLGVISIDLGLEERKREIGLLKSRGASNQQIIGFLLIEALILGIIAGFIGIIFGIISGKFFMSIFFTQDNNSIINPFTEFNLSLEMIIIGLGLGILFVLAASYRMIKKFSKLSIVECFAHHSTLIEEKEYKPGRDIILLGLGIFTFMMMIILNTSKFNYELGIFESILLIILTIMTFILMPLFPFFIVFSVTRLITKRATIVYDYISRVTKYLTKDLWYLINKNITRNPRRAIGITCIIALSLAFGIFISSTIDTNDVYNRRIIEAEVGADILLESHNIGYYDVGYYDIEYYDMEYYDTEFQETGQQHFYNLSNILLKVEGIEKITEVMTYNGNFPVPISKLNRNANLYMINISTYYNAVKPDNYFFLGKNPKKVISKLKDENSILIDDFYAKEEGYSIGDKIPISISVYHYDENGNRIGTKQYLNLKIVGIVRLLPGVLEEIEIDSRENYNFYTAINSKLGKILENESYYYKILIKVKPKHDHLKVAETVYSITPYYYDSIRVKQEELDIIIKNPEYYSINAFLKTEYIFTIMIITIGLGLLLYISGIERKQEMGSIISRGASPKQIKYLYFGEGVTTLILGSTLGIVTGLLVSMGFNSLLFAQTSIIEREFIISLNTIAIIIFPLITLFVITYVVSAIVSKIKLYQVLRLRGG